MKLQPALADLLRQAYSAEKAAAFAYQGHAGAVKNKAEKAAIHQIEIDEWNHRREVLAIMGLYDIKPSRWYEIRFHVVGKIISGSCYVIGWFMPFYFAGRLDDGIFYRGVVAVAGLDVYTGYILCRRSPRVVHGRGGHHVLRTHPACETFGDAVVYVPDLGFVSCSCTLGHSINNI